MDDFEPTPIYPASIAMPAATEDRNRLTVAFRFFLALPHVLIVGGPLAFIGCSRWAAEDGWHWGVGSGTGVLGLVAGVAAFIAWFAILFTREHPDGLWKLAAFYLRWRVRAIAYMALLRDEYPPFGDEPYPAALSLDMPAGPRSRSRVLFRWILALPHVIILSVLGVVWGIATAFAWIAILLTGRYPETLYGFSLGVFAWEVRVEAYMLLLRDEYPPFTLRA